MGPLQMQTSHEGPRGMVRVGLALRYAVTHLRDSMTQRGESVGWPRPRLGFSCDSGPTDEDDNSRTMAKGRGQRGRQPDCRSPRGLNTVLGSGAALEVVPKCGRSADRKCDGDAWFRVLIGQVDLGEFQPRDGLQACGRSRDREGRASAVPGAAKWACRTMAGGRPLVAWERGCHGRAARIGISRCGASLEGQFWTGVG